MVFAIEQLHRIRASEIERVSEELPAGAVILEIGAGTGYQSKMLSNLGFRVLAIDLPTSSYAEARVYPVTNYDGHTLPVLSGSVDVVFSSNVLEHVADLARLHTEIRRVLKPNGFCLHIMPSPSWRLWTTVSGWLDVGPALGDWALRQMRDAGRGSFSLRRLSGLIRLVGGRIIPRRHGERGTAVSELWTFSMRSWCKHFRTMGFEVQVARNMGTFYTGFMLCGERLSMQRRRELARWLGSACNMYIVRPSVPV